jgi:hypothetical protein
MGQKEMAVTVTGKNRIMIFGPKPAGTYVVGFRTAAGETLAISVPVGETRDLNTSRRACPMGCSCLTFREERPARLCVFRGKKPSIIFNDCP